MITKNDIPRFTGRNDWTDTITHQGYSVRVRVSYDECMGAPWKEHDGHGPVSDWRRQGERAARAAHADYEYLRRWCNNEWCWIVVTVEVSRAGHVLDTDSCGGIESDGDYWREHAADSANAIIRADRRERRERKYWAARGVETRA